MLDYPLPELMSSSDYLRKDKRAIAFLSQKPLGPGDTASVRNHSSTPALAPNPLKVIYKR